MVITDNFLHERGVQRFSCWVASWRKRVVQQFDGLLYVFSIDDQITIAL